MGFHLPRVRPPLTTYTACSLLDCAQLPSCPPLCPIHSINLTLTQARGCLRPCSVSASPLEQETPEVPGTSIPDCPAVS